MWNLFVAAYLQAFDLVIGQVGLIIDLLKVNISVRIGLGHDDELSEEEIGVKEEVIVNNGNADNYYKQVRW